MAGREQALTVTEPVFITGRTVDANDRPLRDAEVAVRQSGKEIAKGRSDGRGDCSITFFRSQTNVLYTLSANAGNFRALMTNQVLVAGENHFDLKLREYFSLSGHVLALDGTPLKGVVVQALVDPPPVIVPPGGLAGELFLLPSVAGGFPEIPSNATPNATNRINEANFRGPSNWPLLSEEGRPGPAEKRWTKVDAGRYVRSLEEKGDESSLARWTKKFELRQPMHVSFTLRASCLARLFVDGEPLIVREEKGEKERTTREVNLEAGEHWVKVEAFRTEPSQACELTWELEGCDNGNGVSLRYDEVRR